MSEIAIYAEGGGPTAAQRAELRQGFDGILGNWKTQARNKKIQWKVVCSGDRQQTYDAFMNAVKTNPQATNVLLVDSEAQVRPRHPDVEEDAKIRVEHLENRDKWKLTGTEAKAINLMAQCMESWIVSDPDALANYYGNDFSPKALPTRANLEDEPKADVYKKLAKATRNTKKKEYAKIRHARELLQKIAPSKVAGRCPRFAIFTDWLSEAITKL